MKITAFGFTTINGLPAHILLVHAVVVLVPLTAFFLIAAALRPSLAVRAGLFGPGLAALALLFVFAAMNAGGWLQSRVAPSPLVRHHTHLAGFLWPFSVAMLLVAVAIWARNNRDGRLGRYARLMPLGNRGAAMSVAAVAVVVALAGLTMVGWIGESGSRAVWTGQFSKTPLAQPKR